MRHLTRSVCHTVLPESEIHRQTKAILTLRLREGLAAGRRTLCLWGPRRTTVHWDLPPDAWVEEEVTICGVRLDVAVLTAPREIRFGIEVRHVHPVRPAKAALLCALGVAWVEVAADLDHSDPYDLPVLTWNASCHPRPPSASPTSASPRIRSTFGGSSGIPPTNAR